MFGASKLARLFPIPPAAILGNGFTIAGVLTGVHTITSDPPVLAVFVRGADGLMYLAKFSQTSADTIELTFSCDGELAKLAEQTARTE